MAIEHLVEKLRGLNLDELREQALSDIRSGKKTRRQRGVKLLRAVEGMQRAGTKPEDLVITKVPVIPAAFRPYSVTGDTFLPGDANELYADLIRARNLYRESVSEIGPEASKPLAEYVRNAVRASYGFGDSPNPKLKARRVSGFNQKILGSNPKVSFVQGKLLSKPQDMVGRAVISPDPDLSMDEVGIPENMAWDIFKDLVERRLAARGIPKVQILRMIRERHPVAKAALDAERRERPVLYSRAPAWHRQSMAAGYAKLVDGDNVKISPLVTAGFNADFNGDDQIGKILVMAIKGSEAENLLSALRCGFSEATVDVMIDKQVIPVFDRDTCRLFLCDMEDLPRGEKIGENPRGKNGHIDFYQAPDGMMALAFDESSGQMKWTGVSGISVHPDREVEVVQLSNDRQIITDDDPRAIYGIDPETSEMVRDTPSNAKARGLLVPCARDVSAACVGLGSADEWVVDEQTQFPLTFEFGYLLGALCGDGWWDKKDYGAQGRRVYLSDRDGFVAAKVGTILRDLFGPVSYSAYAFKASEIEGRYGDSVRHTFGGRRKNLDAFVEFCAQWMGGHADESTAGSGNKKLPDVFLLAPAEFRRGLLTGLFDTDGSCSVSNAKNKPQLLCAVTTTSVRLAADLKFLCLTLGVHASVCFSRITERGNNSWICSVSAVGLREQGDLLRDLQNPEKRENFLRTPVSGSNTSLVHNKAAVPRPVFDLVQTDLVAPKITKADRASPGPDLDWKRRQMNMVIQWSKGKHEGVISRPSARKVLAHLDELYSRRVIARDKALVLLRSGVVELTEANVEILRRGFYATAAPFSADRDKESAAHRLSSSLKTAVHRCRKKGDLALGTTTASRMEKALSEAPVYRGALDSDILKDWVNGILDNEAVTWATVTDVQKTGIRETGYDLTVPGYETFMSAEGVVLSNTMSVHTPITPEAVQDAKEKLLPSKMLFSVRNRDATLPVPKHEMLLGLFANQMKPSGNVVKVQSEDEALKLYEAGQLKPEDQIELPTKL